MGDMPIYVGYHSADVWANRKSFLLVHLNNFPSQSCVIGFLKCYTFCFLIVFSGVKDKNGFPTFVSGVPPDAFSETGQLWNR